MALDAGTIASAFLQEHLALFDYSLKAQVLASQRLQAAFTGKTTTGYRLVTGQNWSNIGFP